MNSLEHLNAIVIRVQTKQVHYEHLAGAVDAYLMVEAITLKEASVILAKAKTPPPTT